MITPKNSLCFRVEREKFRSDHPSHAEREILMMLMMVAKRPFMWPHSKPERNLVKQFLPLASVCLPERFG